jgi:RimJ/RimL family protein N-acetyltransferase
VRHSSVGVDGEIKPPRLTDGVILLDGYRLSDVDAHLQGEDEETARRFGWYPKRSTVETVRAAIQRWQENWRTGGNRRAWAARDVATGRLLGGCEVRLQGDGVGEMAYWTAWDSRGRGVASRAARLACDYAFRELGVERMEVQVAPDNLPSRRVAERAGFVEEGIVREGERLGAERGDMVLYSRHALPSPAPPGPTTAISIEPGSSLVVGAGSAVPASGSAVPDSGLASLQVSETPLRSGRAE